MAFAAVMLAAGSASAPAAETPAPNVVRVKSGAAEIARAAAATLRNQPKRVVRLPARAIAPAVAVPQDVVVAVKRNSPSGPGLATFCDAHPLLVDGVSGTLTPRGTITVRGACFGTTHGDVMMLGTFPGGAVTLPVTTWVDNAVTAVVPAITGVTDQTVRIRLSRANTKLANPRGTAIAAPVVSEPVSMLFTAARVTTIARQDWVVNVSCGRQGSTPDNLDSCDAFTAASGAWFDETQAERLVYHVRRNAPAAAGEDSWQTRLPAGWTFDRIEFVSSSPGTDIAIVPTMNNAFVQWRVTWKTMRMSDANGPREEADYLMAVYATGPAGMDRVPR